MKGFDHEDGSCPECGGHAVERINKMRGTIFHGCSNYPRCLNTEPIRQSRGDFLLSDDDILRAYYEAFYDGDG